MTSQKLHCSEFALGNTDYVFQLEIRTRHVETAARHASIELSYTDSDFKCYHWATLILHFTRTCYLIELHWSLLYVLPLSYTNLTLYMQPLSYTDLYCTLPLSYTDLTLYVLPLSYTDLYFTRYLWATLISTLCATIELHWPYSLRATIELHLSFHFACYHWATLILLFTCCHLASLILPLYVLPLSYTCLFFTCYHCATLISSLGTTIELHWSLLYHLLLSYTDLTLYVLPLSYTDLYLTCYHWATLISDFKMLLWWPLEHRWAGSPGPQLPQPRP